MCAYVGDDLCVGSGFLSNSHVVEDFGFFLGSSVIVPQEDAALVSVSRDG